MITLLCTLISGELIRTIIGEQHTTKVLTSNWLNSNTFNLQKIIMFPKCLKSKLAFEVFYIFPLWT